MSWFDRFSVVAGALALAAAAGACTAAPPSFEETRNAGREAMKERDYDQAERHFRTALETAKAYSADDERRLDALDDLAAVYIAKKDYKQAESFRLQALQEREAAFGVEHRDVVASLERLALLYVDQKKYAEAEPLLERALAVRERMRGPGHKDLAATLDRIGALHLEQRNYDEAQQAYERALAIRDAGPEERATATTLRELGDVYVAKQRYPEAETVFRRAVAILERDRGPEHPTVAAVLERYQELLRLMDRPDEAAGLDARIAAIRAAQSN
jgi:tetratricopeptide (TPR) repeat protein